MEKWAMILINGPLSGREVDGTVRARGEDFEDIWHMVADSSTSSLTRFPGWPA